MGKPALLELIDLVEEKREDDPLLAYSTILELIAFINENPSYQRYISLLTSIKDALSKTLSPQLLNALPITLFRGRSVELHFECNPKIKEHLRFALGDINLAMQEKGGIITCMVPATTQQSLFLTCYVNNNVLSEYRIPIKAPVEMDDLGL
jgi:hypothetical protein